jgi:hypothetical protein
MMPSRRSYPVLVARSQLNVNTLFVPFYVVNPFCGGLRSCSEGEEHVSVRKTTSKRYITLRQGGCFTESRRKS